MIFWEILRHGSGSVLQLAPCSDLWQLRSAAGSGAAAAYTTPQMFSAPNTLPLNETYAHLVITKTWNVCGSSAPQINQGNTRSLLQFSLVPVEICMPTSQVIRHLPKPSSLSKHEWLVSKRFFSTETYLLEGCPPIHPVSLGESKDTSCNSAVARLMASKVTFPFRMFFHGVG